MGKLRRRHFTILGQYGLLQRPVLYLAVELNKLVHRLAFYLESRQVFEYAIDHAIRFRKAGNTNVFEIDDPDIGRCELTLRRGTSDFAVFADCILKKQYASIVKLMQFYCPADSIRTIVDAGSNIGLTALYFSRSFPTARIISLEPEESNYSSCCATVRANKLTNVSVMRAALWSADEMLTISKDFRDGREWAFRVGRGDTSVAHGGVEGISLRTLAARHGLDSFDLLKIDIEGAEKVVLLEDSEAPAWLRRTRFLAMEIHDEDGYRRLLPLLERCGFVVIRDGELTLGVRSDLARQNGFPGEAPPQ